MKRRLFRCLLGLSLALSAGWVVYTPYQPGRVYRAIPARAEFVSSHLELPARLDDYAANPLALSLFSPSGLYGERLQALIQRSGFRWLLRVLGGREVVCGYVPGLRHRGESGWVFSSWIGGRSQLIRWILSVRSIPALKRERTPRGRTCWAMALPGGAGIVRVAFVEGVLLGCLMGSDRLIDEMIDCYDGRQASEIYFYEHLQRLQTCPTGGARDFGWINLQARGARTWGFNPLLHFRIDELGADRLRAQFCSATPLLDAAPETTPEQRAWLARWLGPLPFTAMWLDAWSAAGFAQVVGGRAAASVVEGLLRENGIDTLFLALTAGPYGGQFFEVKIPALVAGGPVLDSEAGLDQMRKAIDRLNTQYQWGLYPREIMVGARRLYVVESANDHVYGRLEMEAKAAYTVCDSNLLVSSSARALMELLARYDRPESAAEAAQADWLAESRSEPVYGWADTREFARHARGLTRLHLARRTSQEPPDQIESLRREFDHTLAWMDALGSFRRAEWRLWGEGRGIRLELDLQGASP
jgi:hypothetical protein